MKLGGFYMEFCGERMCGSPPGPASGNAIPWCRRIRLRLYSGHLCHGPSEDVRFRTFMKWIASIKVMWDALCTWAPPRMYNDLDPTRVS